MHESDLCTLVAIMVRLFISMRSEAMAEAAILKRELEKHGITTHLSQCGGGATVGGGGGDNGVAAEEETTGWWHASEQLMRLRWW